MKVTDEEMKRMHGRTKLGREGVFEEVRAEKEERKKKN